jgi:thiol-disulfide isomerase/thioredoxin
MIEISSKRELQNELRSTGRTIVCFCASWCPFCDRFSPVFDEYASRSTSDVFVRVFIDEDSNPLWEDFSIEAVPTLVLFDNGNMIRRLDGGLGAGVNERQFAEWLKKH